VRRYVGFNLFNGQMASYFACRLASDAIGYRDESETLIYAKCVFVFLSSVSLVGLSCEFQVVHPRHCVWPSFVILQITAHTYVLLTVSGASLAACA
jgi:hypothetical protein